MKRNWKVDNLAQVGEYKFWHGDYNRLPAPWVHRCFDKHPWSDTSQNRCPAAYQGRSFGGGYTTLCVIQKLDNLQYLEYKYDKKTGA